MKKPTQTLETYLSDVEHFQQMKVICAINFIIPFDSLEVQNS